MNKDHQIKLIVGIIEDYQNCLMNLGALTGKIQDILSILQDEILREMISEDIIALEEVYAVTQIGDFDFEKYGQPVVDTALRHMSLKISDYDSKICRT